MRIKSYFAPSVEIALVQARQELGDEAMLVKTRRSMPDARHLGEYEVIFAADAPEAGADGMPSGLAPPRGSNPPPDRLSLEIAELKQELEGMRRSLAHSAFAPPQNLGGSADAAEAYAALAGADVAPELARNLVEAAEERRSASRSEAGRANRRESDPLEPWLAEEIESRVTTQAELGRGGRPRVVALVGPPGAGKTTTLVKLAVSFGLASRRPALLLSMDTYRIAAAEQLRCYAAILGIGCQVLETATSLAQAIEENGGKDLILIDTPGLGVGDLETAAGLSRLLAARSDIDTHLVLPASMKSGDLSRAAAAYEIFAPQKLLFTKLDETDTFGPILNQAIQTGKALSFFTLGQRIPEDLETATRRRLTELVLAGPGTMVARGARTAA
jgi:flagellar biosynthesis protein FlhF